MGREERRSSLSGFGGARSTHAPNPRTHTLPRQTASYLRDRLQGRRAQTRRAGVPLRRVAAPLQTPTRAPLSFSSSPIHLRRRLVLRQDELGHALRLVLGAPRPGVPDRQAAVAVPPPGENTDKEEERGQARGRRAERGQGGDRRRGRRVAAGRATRTPTATHAFPGQGRRRGVNRAPGGAVRGDGGGFGGAGPGEEEQRSEQGGDRDGRRRPRRRPPPTGGGAGRTRRPGGCGRAARAAAGGGAPVGRGFGPHLRRKQRRPKASMDQAHLPFFFS